MIVQDKYNQLEYYGAVQFHTDGKKMSLAKYPGVKMKRGLGAIPPIPGLEGKIGIGDDDNKDFYYHNIELIDGDWLVTDKEGRTQVYTDKKFKKSFVEKEV